jgi:hypothetical protein
LTLFKQLLDIKRRQVIIRRLPFGQFRILKRGKEKLDLADDGAFST